MADFPDTGASPARKLVAITPNDGADIAANCKALWVVTGGTLAVVAVDDTSNTGVALGTLTAGTVVPVRVRRVPATGTTAVVLGLY